ncbi:MAG: shikimate dehydrogenase [Anaerolineae bacterium]|nr:shikimate dehydrogenase [Anaerolineae bacterium]
MDGINGGTQLVGVMGWPVAHSLSPAMHNAAFAALGLNWRYVPLPVHPDHVGDAVRGLRALGFAGCNVTVPHKQAVMPHLSGLSDEAAALGAVNTLVRDGDAWRGENTDARGFLDDLAAHGVDVAGGLCVVLGAGGSARAVAWGLLKARRAREGLQPRARPRCRPGR